MRLSGLCLSLLLVLAAACNVGLGDGSGTTVVGGTGGAGGAGATGGAGGAVATGGAGGAGVIGPGGMVMGCSLLQASCPGGQACFPYPFDSGSPTTTACGYPGTGDVSIPCQTQLECDGSSVCSNPGDPASLCLARCDLQLPYCGLGSYCIGLKAFPNVGACTI